MKLLKKSTVQIEAQSQRKGQIEEGMNIARKVDSLRQTLAELQAQHAKFISGMEKELQDRTQPLILKIASLQQDIAGLEEKRKALLVPLDEEWAKLHKKQHELAQTDSELEKKKEKVALKEENLVALGTELKSRLFKVKTRERELAKALREAYESLYIADEKKAEAIKVRNEADEYSEASGRVLLTLEADIAVREREVEMLKKHVGEREKDLSKREVLLKDRTAMLERSIKRNG